MFRRKPGATSERWLIVGLGNPGPEYARSRHNIGFLCLDALAQRYDGQIRHRAARSLLDRVRVGDREIILAKPQTMMNLSGAAVRALREKYGVALERLAVIHDDLDLPFGRLRVRRDGSAAGHHGVESIIGALASRDFMRFRVGIDRPVGEGMDYVLGAFTEAEREQLPGVVARVGDAILFALEHGIERAMTEFNKR